MFVLWIGQLEDVEADMEVRVRRIEIDNVLHALLRDLVEDAFNEFAVRIDNAKSLAVRDVLDDHIMQKGGFSGTGLPYHVGMLTPIAPLNAKKPIRIAEIGTGKIDYVIIKFFVCHLLLLYHEIGGV